MRNPVGWFELGVKQQENERESMAIQALQRAVELDPSYLEAWLALAISHTNENEKSGAYDAIEHWVRNNERYKDRQPLRLMEEMSGTERHEQLLQCLMGLARAAPEVDADVQTALGVLLNTCEVSDLPCSLIMGVDTVFFLTGLRESAGLFRGCTCCATECMQVPCGVFRR